ncbi:MULTISPECIES: hypothetical protein [unclassified Paenibacillus]|uniref:hypothetical protein n=1 Tax=unclassified Paenibacillus TaxID=185978 RepID=UPI00095675ED|nr:MULTISPECIES: hypothetical protein [unclassified Paenibacillus]ASS67138.1 hypothetical protein CIC07_14065 [Paenibacillus sp. RUD330]SIQ88718.1 hypothetical protein SAMN05880555_2614 [Paenibacillus sp. RU4X]SIR09651.1 hypothetical protein SAMN05880570_2614 [Paenibacillus sp. RU4T]
MNPLQIEEFAELLLSGNRSAAEATVLHWKKNGANQLALLQQLFSPALGHIALLAESRRIGMAEERLGHGLCQWLLCRHEPAEPLQGGGAQFLSRKAMLLGLDGEPHDLGMRMDASMFKERGWMTRMYGSVLPLEHAVFGAMQWTPDAVCLHADSPESLPAARAYAEKLLNLPWAPSVLLSGRAASLPGLPSLARGEAAIVRSLLDLDLWLAEAEREQEVEAFSETTG